MSLRTAYWEDKMSLGQVGEMVNGIDILKRRLMNRVSVNLR